MHVNNLPYTAIPWIGNFQLKTNVLYFPNYGNNLSLLAWDFPALSIEFDLDKFKGT